MTEPTDAEIMLEASKVGGNGQKRIAATRKNIDAAMATNGGNK